MQAAKIRRKKNVRLVEQNSGPPNRSYSIVLSCVGFVCFTYAMSKHIHSAGANEEKQSREESLPLVGLSGSLAYFTIAKGAEVQRETERRRAALTTLERVRV